MNAYENICSLFGFLRKLESMDCDEIEAAAAKLVSEYKDDLDQTLGVELVQFAAFSLISWNTKKMRKLRIR